MSEESPITVLEHEDNERNTVLEVEYKGMRIDRVRDPENPDKTVVLHEHSVKLDTQKLTLEQLKKLNKQRGKEVPYDEDDVQFLRKFKQVSLTVWTPDGEITDWEEKLGKEHNIVILIGSGYDSNTSQLINPDCSLAHNTINRLNNRIDHRYRDDFDKTIIAIDCPGFGGTELLNESKITTNDVSAETYARLCALMADIANISTDIGLGVGHSAGGEAMLQLAFTNKYKRKLPVVALNPAVQVDHAVQFDVINSLDKISKVAKPWIDGVVIPVEELILRKFIGVDVNKKHSQLTKAEVAQIKLHQSEMQRPAHQAKAKELAKRDTIDPDTCVINDIPAILVSRKDELTYQKQELKYLNGQTIQRGIERYGITFPELTDPAMRDQIAEDLKSRMITQIEGGHDAVFMYADAQEAAIDLIEEKITNSLQIGGLMREVSQILTYLHAHDHLVNIKYEPGSTIGLTDILTAMQDHTLKPADARKAVEYIFNMRKSLHEEQTNVKWEEAVIRMSAWQDKFTDQSTGRFAVPLEEQEQVLMDLLNTNEIHSNAPRYMFDDKGLPILRDEAGKVNPSWINQLKLTLDEHALKSDPGISVFETYVYNMVDTYIRPSLDSERNIEELEQTAKTQCDAIKEIMTTAPKLKIVTGNIAPNFIFNAKDIQVLTQIAA
ncbi:MAG: alpha/beta hydrolase [bacterium]|nr:alpha/beta hydrolase [bacterium]